MIKVDIPRDRETGAQKAFAFATVASEADAEKIIGKTFEIDGRTVDAKPSRRRGEGPQANAGGAQPRKIFIGGVPPGISGET